MGKNDKTAAQSNKKATRHSQHITEAKKKKKPTQSTNGGQNIVIPAQMVTCTVPPQNWPSDMPYLAVAHQSQSLTHAQQLVLQPDVLPSDPKPYSVPTLAIFSPTSNALVQIRSVSDVNHPAYPQCGLFAAKTLAPGTHIVDYTGMIHSCPQESCSTSDYDLAFLDRDAAIAIDSANVGNEGRFVNDYHGIRDEGPNAVFEEYYVKVKSAKGGREVWQARMGIWVAPLTSRQTQRNNVSVGIAKGEEICVSYGKGWWRARRSLLEDQNDESGQEPGESDMTANEHDTVETPS